MAIQKSKYTSPTIIIVAVAIVLAISLKVNNNLTSANHPTEVPATPRISSEALQMVNIPKQIPQQIIKYQAMTVSFNEHTHQPNWVAWELLDTETEGDNKREQSAGFATDPNVPGCPTIADYKKSGFDRGHMAPAGDMKWSKAALNQSFYFTNICPQANELNRGAWNKLEEKCRSRAKADSAIIIVCGPIFSPNLKHKIIGKTNKIPVPDKFFKVILSPYTNPPQAIGFIMPNAYVEGGMQPHAVSVDSVESITGYDFFQALPDEIENRIEATANFSRWATIKPKR